MNCPEFDRREKWRGQGRGTPCRPHMPESVAAPSWQRHSTRSALVLQAYRLCNNVQAYRLCNNVQAYRLCMLVLQESPIWQRHSIRSALVLQAYRLCITKRTAVPHIRKRNPLGPYWRPTPRVLGGSSGGRRSLWARYPCTAQGLFEDLYRE